MWIGFDLGGTKMRAALFSDELQISGVVKRKTRPKSAVSLSWDDGLKRIVKTIDELLREQAVDRSELRGIGFGVPGPVDMKKGVLEEAPNLGWKSLPIRNAVESLYKCPVAVANDVDAGTFGEYSAGAAKGADVALGAFPGTGLGGGLVVRGELYHGARLSCMELGHMLFDLEGDLCGCGQFGCLETTCSRLSVSQRAAVEVVRGRAPALAELAGSDLRNIRSGTLRAAAESDPTISDLLNRSISNLGAALGGMVNLLGPDVIVLGGGMVEAMPERYIEGVKQAIDRRVMAVYQGSYQVVEAKLGDDAVCIGAAGLAIQKVNKV